MKLINKTWKITILAILVLVMTNLTGCFTGIYSKEAHEVKIVDADTGKPVSGAVIIAIWGDWGYGMEGGTHNGTAKVQDQLSDNNGIVYFPASGPALLNTRYVLDSEPELIVYKSGYHLLKTNRYAFDCKGEDCDIANVTPKEIQLYRNAGSIEAIAKTSATLKQEFENAEVETCDWKKMRHLLLAQVNDKIMYAANKMKSPYLYVDAVWHSEIMNLQRGCGSGQEFISTIYADYLKKSHQAMPHLQVSERLKKLFYKKQERVRGKVKVLAPGINYMMPVVPNIQHLKNPDKNRKELK